jgi:hypothetical protein
MLAALTERAACASVACRNRPHPNMSPRTHATECPPHTFVHIATLLLRLLALLPFFCLLLCNTLHTLAVLQAGPAPADCNACCQPTCTEPGAQEAAGAQRCGIPH